MQKLLLFAVVVTVAGGFAAAQAANHSSLKTAICHKTGSKTHPYQRIVVPTKAALAAHVKHADDIIPAPASCPQALLTARSGGVPISVAMRGVLEQPDPADADGTGTATLRLRAGQGRICFALDVKDIALPATGAHIHSGAVDAAGPIVVALTPPSAAGSSQGCVAANRSVVTQILRNRAGFYVNVHTSDFPAGAIRGQLAIPGSLTLLTATMTGSAERPNPGDADGSGTVALAIFGSKLCYTGAVRGINLPATGFHVHRGGADVAGPVVIPLTPPNAGGTSAACVTPDAALLTEITGNPAGFYVNVHTSDFPAGALRGVLAHA